MALIMVIKRKISKIRIDISFKSFTLYQKKSILEEHIAYIYLAKCTKI